MCVKIVSKMLFLSSLAIISTRTLPARAADDAAPPAKAAGNANSPSAALDRFETNVNSLNLTDAQKPKIDKYFAKARQDITAQEDNTDAKDRDQKIHAISTRIRSQIADVLTNEQKADLVKKMAPPAVDTDAMIDRIKQDLDKPDSKLTAEQKAKADAVLDDTKKKLADLRASARQTHTDVRPKVQEVLADMKQKLSEILKG